MWSYANVTPHVSFISTFLSIFLRVSSKPVSQIHNIFLFFLDFKTFSIRTVSMFKTRYVFMCIYAEEKFWKVSFWLVKWYIKLPCFLYFRSRLYGSKMVTGPEKIEEHEKKFSQILSRTRKIIFFAAAVSLFLFILLM